MLTSIEDFYPTDCAECAFAGETHEDYQDHIMEEHNA